MKSRERVFIALNGGIPDKFPRTENDIEEGLQRMIMGTINFNLGELCEKLGMGGFGYHFPMGGKAATGRAFQADAGFKEAYYYPQRITIAK